jgi:putative two-component system response regulator
MKQLPPKRTKLMANAINDSGPVISDAFVASIHQTLQLMFQGITPADESFVDHNSAILAKLHAIGGETTPLIDLLLDCTRYFLRLGKTVKGIPLAERSLELAQRISDMPRIRVASNTLGACYQDIGNVPMALERLEQSLSAANKLNDPVQVGSVMANVGAVLQTAGLYAEAIESHQLNIERLGQRDDIKSMEAKFQSLGNQIFCARRLGKTELLKQSIDELDELSRNDTINQINEMSKALAELHIVNGLIYLNQTEAAHVRISAARARYQATANPRTQILLEMAQGMVETRTERSDVGVTRLVNVYAHCKSTGLYYDDALRSLVEGYIMARDNANALKYVDELTAYIKRTQLVRINEQILLAARIKERDFGAYSDESNLVEKLAADTRLARARELLGKDQIELYQSWAVTVELIDDSTGEHCFRVGRMSSLIAELCGYPAEYCEMIDVAARLHDLGKVGISHNILLHPGKLSIGDIGVMRAHSEIGHALLSQVAEPTFRMAADIAYAHHEWWDGGGYPRRLGGAGIPTAARIVALADVYDALTHQRCYKRAWSHEEAMREIISLRGKQFDPFFADAFAVAVEKWRREGIAEIVKQTARKCQMLDSTAKLMASVRA